jgi:FlaA1/EpsC-like NDP-sugar epimerase
MMRYFMTIPEAVQLVLQAATLGTGGETFVLDMGEPVKIVDLAKDLIKLSGYEIGADIRIEYTGLRAGEKLIEELFAGDEEHRRTVHEKVFVGRNGQGLNFENTAQAQALVEAAQEGRILEMEEQLREMLPDFPIKLDHAVPVPVSILSSSNGGTALASAARRTKSSAVS